MNESENTKSEFNVGQYLTYIGPLIIFFGVLRQIIFYNAFGVSIVSYLDFSEIITSFFDIIVFVIIFFTYSSIQNFLMSSVEELTESYERRKTLVNEKSFWKIVWFYLLYLQRLLLGSAFIIIIYSTLCYFVKEVTLQGLVTVIITIVILAFFVIIDVEIERKHIQFNSSLARRRWISLNLYSLVIIFAIVFYSSYQAGTIRKDKTTYGVSILFDNDHLMVSDSLNYYVGKTQNYLFIHHQKLNTTDVIPMERVRQITLRGRSDSR